MKILDVPQSGSVAGVTSSRNRFGQYRRTRAMPTQPRTSRQVENREALASISSGWRNLTALQRAAWAALAAQLPKTDSLGQTVFGTGLQTFIGFNQIRTSLALAILDDAPIAAEVPPIGNFLFEPLAPVIPPSTMEITLDDAVPADHAVLVFASPPRSAGVAFEGQFRLFSRILAAATTVDIATLWQARFGTLIEGQQIFVRLIMVTIEGQAGAPTQARAIVAV